MADEIASEIVRPYRKRDPVTRNSPQKIQHCQYEYPYHHIPYFKGEGDAARVRMLNWGFEYLIYMEHVIELICSQSPRSVLDVGCGDGCLVGHLPASISVRVGADIDERAISFARAFFPDPEFRQQDIATIKEKFDVVSAIEVLEHIPDEEVGSFLAAVAARIAPGGILLLTVPTVNLPLNPKHFRHYDLELLMKQAERPLSEMVMEHSEYFYVPTLLERLYRKATQSPFCYGEIPILRRRVYRHARSRAKKARHDTGSHLVAIFRHPSERLGSKGDIDA